MCGRYGRRADKQRIAEWMRTHNTDVFDDSYLAPSYNVAPQSLQPVVRLSSETGERELTIMRWGLIPFFAKDAKIAYSTINARAETVVTSPVFREPMKRRRCLVPADLFWEWQKIDAKTKQPYAIAMQDDSLFAFAGLWDTWKDKTTSQATDTYTLNVATRFAFALFAFHREIDHFDDMDFWPMQLSAATIGHVLKSRNLEREARQMKAFELMGKSYGSMAHDLSTSLSQDVLFGNLNQAIRDHEWEKAARYSEDARRLSERASSIVKTFREMARGQNQSDSTFDLVEAVASVVHSFKASGCTLNSNCEVVKYEGSTCLVQMRKAGLEQILFNLLLNAAQQIDRLQPLRKSQGEILVEVQTTKDPLDGIWAQILVHDNGPGIHHCDFDRIFDMNYTTKEDGCGLGLSISRDIANRVVVGGRTGSLTVRRSILLAGSTFELKLPF